MPASFKPWGRAEWLLPRTGIEKWHLIASASFEDRCLAVPEWLQVRGLAATVSLLSISNPPSEHWRKASPLVSANANALSQRFGPTLNRMNVDLMDSPSNALPLTEMLAGAKESVILDITTIPKKFFVFALKRLLSEVSVRNLLVTYTGAGGYPEGALCEDALPPAALQGYGRIEEAVRSRMIVDVGYMPLSVEDLLDTAKHSKLDFIFPFPPASPAYRRNWALLSMLMPDEIPRSTEVHRIHGMDAFEVFQRVKSWGAGNDLDLVPLGPKPHTLGLAMACLRLDGRAELIYSQPRTYHHAYSRGVAKDQAGQPILYAYCLKYGGRQLF